MKKQPIDTHPTDQYMQALDGKLLPLVNEVHWEGMRALLNQNFPQEMEPRGGEAHSDSRPEVGAGKAVKRFRWLFLGGVALITTLAATQWNAMAFQNSNINQEIHMQENMNSQNERSVGGIGKTEIGSSEVISRSNSETNRHSGMGNLSNQEAATIASDSGETLSNLGQEHRVQQQVDGHVINDSAIKSDSLPVEKLVEPVIDSASVKKKKFIFW